MMLGGATQQSLRKYLGAIKDSTTVGLAKVNSEYKDLDIAIVKATNHYEDPSKEKHIRVIFAAISAGRPRTDVVYCIQALARRLAKTRNWAVALKTLIVIHRALREVDHTFGEELIHYGRTRSYMLNLTHFRDDSSHEAWEYSSWVRTYALFLEERLECFHVLKYDIQIEPAKTRDLNVSDLLEQLPALLQLLFRLLDCEPQGAAMENVTIRLALSVVAGESIKLYNAITDGVINLNDKFFDMQRHAAVRALEIYKKAKQQVGRLSEFYETCKRIDVWHGEKFIMIEEPYATPLKVMEEHVKNAKVFSSQRELNQLIDENADSRKEILEADLNDFPETPEESESSSRSHDLAKAATAVPGSIELLGMIGDANPTTSELHKPNEMDFGISQFDNVGAAFPSNLNFEKQTAGWEMDLVSGPTSTSSVLDSSNLGGGLDKLTLDSLYDEAMRQPNQTASYNPWDMPQMWVNEPQHMEMMTQQQQAFVFQDQRMVGQETQTTGNPFGNINDSFEFHQTTNTFRGPS